ncbi:Selenocysteine lyase/Cysteine desulfurase [Geodermatophilus telluris]|uniref:Selenocysteine lyase/Cysteine desulfurase n=1 Tax=Geodermatophilus telluris TaxID=1190417 RepID=A0A1G6IYN4_9ACTN|nr:aminotransferase class V-fold PLP-dependent enzyme [Geodermatophilus telluris]SDC11614.1 Selenocysteine lyase/Cysteine desulfurase [Geodermatophilus telluris]
MRADLTCMEMTPSFTAGQYVGDDLWVSVLDGRPRQYVDLDTAATSSASVVVARAVQDFLPWYASVHRGAGIRSQLTSARYEEAREVITRFVGGDPATHVTLFPRNTTEAINLLAFRLGLTRDDVVVTTAVEHHANLLPWRRHAQLRVVDVDASGAFDVAAVEAALDQHPRPRVLAVTGGSNVTGWLPDLRAIAAAARQRGVLVVVDGAQLVPHRAVDISALGVDVIAFSGHKMYAPFGAGALVVPRALLAGGEPFLVGGGAVGAVSFDDVIWADGPDRDDAGSPNVVGVVALMAAADELRSDGWSTVRAHEDHLVRALDSELRSVPGLRRLGPVTGDRLPVAAFNLEGVPHGLLAARLANEYAIGTRSGCFCAHPYMGRLLGLSDAEVGQFHADVRAGNRHRLPGAVRVSANRQTYLTDIPLLGQALREIAASPEGAAQYVLDERGDYVPRVRPRLPVSV